MRVNYGRQASYRRHGTEPACRSCTHFGAAAAPRGELVDKRWCPANEWYVAPDDLCTSYERAAGAD